MATASTLPRISLEEFFRMDHSGFELVDGRMEALAIGAKSSWLAGEIEGQLRDYLKVNGGGWVFPQETAFSAWPGHPNKVRKPDVMFIRSDRLSTLPDGHIPIAPDLAIEVVSPGDEAVKLAEKLEDYAVAGIPLVWVIYPELKQAQVYRRGVREIFRESESLSGEDVLPGFRLDLQ